MLALKIYIHFLFTTSISFQFITKALEQTHIFKVIMLVHAIYQYTRFNTRSFSDFIFRHPYELSLN